MTLATSWLLEELESDGHIVTRYYVTAEPATPAQVRLFWTASKLKGNHTGCRLLAIQQYWPGAMPGIPMADSGL